MFSPHEWSFNQSGPAQLSEFVFEISALSEHLISFDGRSRRGRLFVSPTLNRAEGSNTQK